MTVQFILGRAGTGKTKFILEGMGERLENNPAGTPFIFLVPEQATFQAEYTLATLPGLSGVIGTQVLSFGRLAYRLLQEMGGMTLLPVDELGKHMVLRMLLERYKDELQVFQRSASQPGFAAKLGRMISECKSYGITFTHMENLDWGSGTLNQKVNDLHVIMGAYDAYLSNTYYDTDDMLTRVAVMIKESAYIRQAEIFIDGFTGFTNQEYRIIEQLMLYAKQVTITLCLDPAQRHASPDELDLFYPTIKTYHTLKTLAEESAVEQLSPILLEEPIRFRESPWLKHVEKQYFEWTEGANPSAPARVDEVMLCSAVSRRAEVEATALRILSLARDEGYRWRDIAISLRDIGTHADDIASVFADYDIPFFLDQKRTVMHHPLIELVRSALEVVTSRWRYDAVFRCLKTDLIKPETETSADIRSEVDQLENYVLAYGIYGSHWAQEATWSFHAQAKDEYEWIDEIRCRYAEPLLAFEKKIKQAIDENVQSTTSALYQFLIDLQVPQTLEHWQQQAEQADDLEAAREHGQIWDGLIDLFDQIVEVMGEESFDLLTYARVLDSGLESMELGLVPPALDQVLIGSMERSRQPDVKALFILGVNDGSIPKRPMEDGILDEAERERLVELGLELAPSAKQRLMAEQYLLYQAMTRPSERLVLSYALADEEGKAVLASPVIQRVREILPDLYQHFFHNEPTGLSEQDSFLLGRPNRVFAHLLTLLHQMKRGGSLSPFWWEVYDWFINCSTNERRERWLLSGLHYTNQPKQLPQETSLALYGKQLRMSVSRLERFQMCPFSHFSSHGLKLTERPLYKLERFDVGDLFHASLKRAVERMNEESIEWGRLTEVRSMQLANEVVEEMVPATRSNILTRTARYRYITGKLKRAVGRAIYVLGEHAKRSRFAPIGLEVSFGPNGELPGMSLTLSNDVNLQLVGRIDRVDQAIGEDRPYLRIIDYKSSPKQLALSDVWNGLNLQLLVYLDVVVTNAEVWLGRKAEVGGVFYYQVADPFIGAKRLLSADEVAKQRAKRLRMKGLMLADTQLAKMMDEQVEQGSSELIPFGLKKDGTFTAASSVATTDQFHVLQSYVRETVKDVSVRMTDGEIGIAPYSQGTALACQICAYKPVCQYDVRMEGNSPRPIGSWNNQQIWTKLQEKADGANGEEREQG